MPPPRPTDDGPRPAACPRRGAARESRRLVARATVFGAGCLVGCRLLAWLFLDGTLLDVYEALLIAGAAWGINHRAGAVAFVEADPGYDDWLAAIEADLAAEDLERAARDPETPGQVLEPVEDIGQRHHVPRAIQEDHVRLLKGARP